MVLSLKSIVAAGLASTAAAAPRYVLYFDQYHTAVLPNRTTTAGITHVITSFANSSLFTTGQQYTPFMNLSQVRAMFDNGTKVCMAIGGWGDTEGFRVGLATEDSRKTYAANIASELNRLGYECVDIDYEYPGGDGYDYKQVPNSDLTSEIETFPLLLSAIKAAIGDKELSIAVPGLERDMIAYTTEQVPKIDAAVDWVNVMTYDLMNRRDNYTTHHTSIQGSLATVDTYIARGMTPAKMNLGLAFYAKWFTLAPNTTCDHPVGCPVSLLEDASGTDTGKSGAATFEKSSFPAAVPANLTTTTSGACGAAQALACDTSSPQYCCSQYGYCGNTTAHCGTGCQAGYGKCDPGSVSTAQSFANALAGGQLDSQLGGMWYVDSTAVPALFWTWDTAALITQKFSDVVAARGLGGVMAWSLAEDSYNWSHLLAMQAGVRALGGGAGNATSGCSKARRLRRLRREGEN